MTSPYQIESLLAARLFLIPQLVNDRLFFVSDLSGRLSLYGMDQAGSVPEPLLPPNVALQNPHLLEGALFHVLPKLGKILVMIDQDGDENYQPMFIPIDGGMPEAVFGDRYADQQVTCTKCDPELLTALFSIDPRVEAIHQTILVDLKTLAIVDLGRSEHGNHPIGVNSDYSQVILADHYTFGDDVLYHWDATKKGRRLLYGKPLSERAEGEVIPFSGLKDACFRPNGNLLLITALFDDCYGLGYLPIAAPEPNTSPDQTHLQPAMQPVEIVGTVHQGVGELVGLTHLAGEQYALTYNIDGCSWVYEGAFDEVKLRFEVSKTLCGQGILSNGVLESLQYNVEKECYAVSFSTATSPSQLYLIDRHGAAPRTQERILGIAPSLLAPGEDAAYTSHDGLRISARLYMPAPQLGFEGKRPVVFYIHGGPQGQERPDYTWFSMPLIQFLTLNGIAVFVPNVRGSEGYGMSYMKRVDRDWGGKDRLDHVAAFEQLRQDERLDMDRAGVMGRSYGGYMTLMQVGRHPDLWKAACDMFGPYDLFTFLERLPPTWQTYFHLVIGHPEHEKEELIYRSPSTYLHNLACPMLVIQGANDPRVVEPESRDLVENLRGQGKDIAYMVFDDEGHDVIKFKNKVRCYNRIVEFFAEQLKP